MDRREFARRRRQFMRMIGKDAIAVLPAAPVRHRNGDIEYAYRQDSQFYYLSGFPEPDAVAVLVPGRPQAEYLLFVREHDALRESWEGAWAGTDGAVVPLRRGRCVSDRGHRRDPARTHGAAVANLLLHGHAPGFRFPHARLGERDARACAGKARARRRNSSRWRTCSTTCVSTRAAPSKASLRRAAQHRHRRAPPRDALRPARADGIRGDGGGAARVPLAQRRYLLSSHRRAAGRTPASCITATTTGGCATATCCCSTPAASTITTPPTSPAPSRSAADSRPRSARSTRWCSRRNSRRSTRCGPATTGISRTRRPCARSPTGSSKLGILKGPVARLIKEQAYLPFFNHRTGPLAGSRRARRRRLQGRGGMAGARAGMALTVEPGIYIRPSPQACPRSSGTSAFASRTTCW